MNRSGGRPEPKTRGLMMVDLAREFQEALAETRKDKSRFGQYRQHGGDEALGLFGETPEGDARTPSSCQVEEIDIPAFSFARREIRASN